MALLLKVDQLVGWSCRLLPELYSWHFVQAWKASQGLDSTLAVVLCPVGTMQCLRGFQLGRRRPVPAGMPLMTQHCAALGLVRFCVGASVNEADSSQ